MKNILIITLILVSLFSFSKSETRENWTESEKEQYDTLKALAYYVNGKEKSEISKDTLFKKFIFFDYVLNDSNLERKEKRLAKFDTLFYSFRNKIKTIGINNLEAKPIRFYKDHKIYEPFDENKSKKETISGEKMYTRSDNVFAYYKKDDPENPLGTLKFEPESDKLLAWIKICQDTYCYFLTFNLL